MEQSRDVHSSYKISHNICIQFWCVLLCFVTFTYNYCLCLIRWAYVIHCFIKMQNTARHWAVSFRIVWRCHKNHAACFCNKPCPCQRCIWTNNTGQMTGEINNIRTAIIIVQDKRQRRNHAEKFKCFINDSLLQWRFSLQLLFVIYAHNYTCSMVYSHNTVAIREECIYWPHESISTCIWRHGLHPCSPFY